MVQQPAGTGFELGQAGHCRRYNKVISISFEKIKRGEDQMASLNFATLASVLVGVDPNLPRNTETQFMRGEEIATFRQMLLDTYGDQSDIARALQARDSAALATALSQAQPPLDADVELERMAQDLLR
jgi:hypothetical protein